MNYLVHHLLQWSAARLPDKEALVYQDERLSYSQLSSTTWQIANGLREIGIVKYDRVGIFLPPCIPIVPSIMAVSAAGGVFVPIHHSLLRHQLTHIVTDCDIKVLITNSHLMKQLDASALDDSSLDHVVVVDESLDISLANAPWELRLLASWSEMDAVPTNESCLENDLAAILYTSGSTGLPKGVMLSHKNILAGASIVAEYLQLTEADRLLAVLPFSFDAGLNQLMTAIQQGASLVLLNFLLAREVVDTLGNERITGLAGVPPFWSLLAHTNSTLSKKRPETLRFVTNTGGPLPIPVLRRLQSALPHTQVFLMYGLTEAFRSTYLPPDQIDLRPTSMGKAIPNTEILVVREDGTLCDPGETGQLVHHGPTVSLGYWGQPKLTSQVFRPHPMPLPGVGDVDRVVFSGDLVYADEEGFLFFVARQDNMIKSSGFRISPHEVETGLIRTGLVHQAAVVGTPDAMLGQKIHAFVVPSEADKFDTDELLTAASEFLPRQMMPKDVKVLDQFPKTASGKVDYNELKSWAEV